MNSSRGKPFAIGAFVTVWCLYLPYFFLPVYQWDSRLIYGYEGIFMAFLLVVPGLSHLCLWIGVVFLLRRSWTAGFICGLSALVPRLLFLWPFPGIYCMLASIILLLILSSIGAIRYQRESITQEQGETP